MIGVEMKILRKKEKPQIINDGFIQPMLVPKTSNPNPNSSTTNKK